MQPENYKFLEIYNWCKWLACNMGTMNFKFLHIPYRCKIEQPATQQCNMELCMWKSFVKIWNLLSLKISILHSSGNSFCRNRQRRKGFRS